MKKAITLIELVMVIVIVGILSVLVIPSILRSRVIANESAAQANVKSISAAIENYATSNNSTYPTSESQLTSANPPYLSQSFCGTTQGGYSYSCSLTTSSYNITASPSNCGGSGTKIYTVTTGGAFTSPDCS